MIEFLLSLEELLYELLLSIFMVPRTLYRIIFYPKYMNGYVLEEFKKEPKFRFNNYLSPILTFTILVIIPYAFLPFSPLAEMLDFGDDIQLKIVVFALYFLSFPLSISAFINFKGKLGLSKEELKMTFYLQCYLFIPPQLIQLVMLFLLYKRYPFTLTPWFIALTFLPVIWIIWRLSSIMMLQLGLQRKTALLLSAFYYVMTFIIISLLFGLFYYQIMK